MNPRRDRSPTNFEVVSKYVGEFNSFGLDKGSKKHFIKEEINSIPHKNEKLYLKLFIVMQ